MKLLRYFGPIGRWWKARKKKQQQISDEDHVSLLASEEEFVDGATMAKLVLITDASSIETGSFSARSLSPTTEEETDADEYGSSSEARTAKSKCPEFPSVKNIIRMFEAKSHDESCSIINPNNSFNVTARVIQIVHGSPRLQDQSNSHRSQQLVPSAIDYLQTFAVIKEESETTINFEAQWREEATDHPYYEEDNGSCIVHDFPLTALDESGFSQTSYDRELSSAPLDAKEERKKQWQAYKEMDLDQTLDSLRRLSNQVS